jgi:NTE family protein
MRPSRSVRVGLALGGGSARGLSHVGVIRALEEAGIRPDLVCGTSIGAVVAAAYAAGELDAFERWVAGLRMREMLGLMDVSLRSGLLKGERLMEFFGRMFVDRPIEELALPFAAVATALHNGQEIWLRDGSTVAAVRASIALPGLVAPALRDGAVLVDGGLVNPVPVSLARAMGADVVIAVDLGSDIVGRHLRADPPRGGRAGLMGSWLRKVEEDLGSRIPPPPPEEPSLPSLLDVLASSLNIMQVRIARSRMAGDPPDIAVAPRLAHLGLLDFHRAAEAIEEGRRAVERVAQNLAALDVRAR